jgi:hypothetical protein
MATSDEEIQAKEFLKRAEIKTMKKDLRALREFDALKERDKIVKLKTLEEQMAEKRKIDETSSFAKATEDKAALEEVLTKNQGQERLAEKDLKNYATEEQRQQIFLLESSRLALEKQIDAINKEKIPELILEKNKLLLQKRDQQAKLDSILEEERKLETEQKFITDREQTTTALAEKKGLEQSRADLDKKIQEVEKKRWEAEKEIQNTDEAIGKIDKLSEQLVIEKNSLQDKVFGVDKSLRDIYSTVMASEEEKRKGKTNEQIANREALAKVREQKKEEIQREQWNPSSTTTPKKPLEIPVPVPVRQKIAKSFEAENEARKKFMQDVNQGTK